MLGMETRLHFDFLKQPDNTTCGPTCLHAVYRYLGLSLSLEDVIRDVPSFAGGGTLAVMLGCDALRRGFDARIFTFNLQVFDPTWFGADGHVRDGLNLDEKLLAQRDCKPKEKLQRACESYREFLHLGGRLRMEDLTGELIRRYLQQNVPLLTGLSSTYLYRERREHPLTGQADDVAGVPGGHFVVLCGYDPRTRSVLVADPFHPNPLSTDYKYEVPLDRVVCSILLGILTYDANLLVIRPRRPAVQLG
ncbi:MAG: hypothetical protein RLZZ436_3170 [Planctomycetota bacterium]|jgi:hypothetical protein